MPIVVRALKLAVAVAVIYSIGRALRGYGHSLVGHVEHLQLGWIAGALVLLILVRLVNAFEWLLVLRSLGHRMPWVAGARMWLVTDTLRWLPGGVWGLFSRAVEATGAGIPPVVASLTSALEVLLQIAAVAVTAIAGLVLSGVTGPLLSRLPTFWLVICAAALVMTVAAAFALARWRPAATIAKRLRTLQEAVRQLRHSRPRAAWLVAAFAYITALFVMQGVAFFWVLRATSESIPSFLAATGIHAAGWLVGFFAFFAPTGIGVREGSLAAMLAPLMPFDAALVAVLIWRLIQVVVELLILVACLLPRMVGALRRLAARAVPESGRTNA